MRLLWHTDFSWPFHLIYTFRPNPFSHFFRISDHFFGLFVLLTKPHWSRQWFTNILFLELLCTTKGLNCFVNYDIHFGSRKRNVFHLQSYRLVSLSICRESDGLSPKIWIKNLLGLWQTYNFTEKYFRKLLAVYTIYYYKYILCIVINKFAVEIFSQHLSQHFPTNYSA